MKRKILQAKTHCHLDKSARCEEVGDCGSFWEEFRKNGLFSDCALVASEGVSYKAHRLLLAAASEYFKVALVRSETNLLSVPFRASLLESILDYVYTGRTSIHDDNVQELLPAADHLCLIELVDKCCAYLRTRITVENAWWVFKFAEFYSCKNLAQDAKSVVLSKFEELVEHRNEFFKMSAEELKSLLKEDMLNVHGEESALNAIDTWICSRVETTAEEINSLFESIRWGYVSDKYVKSWLETRSYNISISAHLVELAVRSSQRKSRANITVIGSPEAYPWRPRIPHSVLFAMGGWSHHLTDSIWTYDIRADKWLNVGETKLRFPIAYHATVSIGNIIYVLGGYNGMAHLNSLLAFDPVSRTWNKKANMYYKRCYISAAVLNEEIYAIGGARGQERLRCVERYNPAKNKWTFVASMQFSRSDAAAVSYDNKIFVFGGCDGDTAHTSAEMYEPAYGVWTLIGHMYLPRRGLAVCLFQDWIYILGGSDCNDSLDCCERFCPRQYIWKYDVPTMMHRRNNFSAVSMEGRLYVIGGHDGNNTIRHTEWFDGRSWTRGEPLRGQKSAMAVCLLTGIPNAYYYSYLCRVESI